MLDHALVHSCFGIHSSFEFRISSFPGPDRSPITTSAPSGPARDPMGHLRDPMGPLWDPTGHPLDLKRTSFFPPLTPLANHNPFAIHPLCKPPTSRELFPFRVHSSASMFLRDPAPTAIPNQRTGQNSIQLAAWAHPPFRATPPDAGISWHGDRHSCLSSNG